MKKYEFKKDPNKQYDEDARNAAKRRCGVIYLVVAYILYQAYGIVKNTINGQTQMGWTETIISAGILVIVSIGVAVFATLKMGREFAESEIKAENQEEITSESEDDES